MLKGRRVALTALVDDDRDALFEWISDRSTMILSSSYRPVSVEEHREWFRSVQRRDDTRIFAIRLLENGRLIGVCQVTAIHPVHRTADLQIRIGPPERRHQGFGSEALELLLGFAFRDLNLHRVQLHVAATNAAAIAAYEKVGFVIEGTQREAAFIDGSYVDLVMMGLLAAEWAPLASSP